MSVVLFPLACALGFFAYGWSILFCLFLLIVTLISLFQGMGLIVCGVISEESLDDIPIWASFLAFLGSIVWPLTLVVGAVLPFFVDKVKVLWGIGVFGVITVPLPVFCLALCAVILFWPRRQELTK